MDKKAMLAEVENEIERLQEVAKLLRGDTKPSTKRRGSRKPMNAEARAKISAAQKRRWAKVNKEKKAA